MRTSQSSPPRLPTRPGSLRRRRRGSSSRRRFGAWKTPDLSRRRASSGFDWRVRPGPLPLVACSVPRAEAFIARCSMLPLLPAAKRPRPSPSTALRALRAHVSPLACGIHRHHTTTSRAPSKAWPPRSAATSSSTRSDRAERRTTATVVGLGGLIWSAAASGHRFAIGGRPFVVVEQRFARGRLVGSRGCWPACC